MQEEQAAGSTGSSSTSKDTITIAKEQLLWYHKTPSDVATQLSDAEKEQALPMIMVFFI
jgi:hypothetical protein